MPDHLSHHEQDAGVTLRAVVVGAIMSVLAAIWPIVSGYLVRSSWADFGQLTLAALLPFILLALVVNPLIHRVRPTLALKRRELLVVLIMAMCAGTMQGEGLAGYFLGVVTAPHYFATGENRWAELLLSEMPTWAIVTNEGQAAALFYDGLPEGETMPWGAWVVPIFWWFSFFAALILVCLCITVALRKQWVENERLPFPLARVPMLLMPAGTGRRIVTSPMFKLGVAIPLCVIVWNAIHWFAPSIPQLPFLTAAWRTPRIRLARGFPPLHGKADVFVMGFAYFSSLDVLFSIWFFHVLSIVQCGILVRTGFSIGSADPWCSWDGATGWQSFGGFAFFVLWGLWMARKHLGMVLRKAVWSRAHIDDSHELMSYRTSVLGLLFGLAYAFFWLRCAGMGAVATAVFLLGTLVLYIGIARITAESGLVYLRGPITAQAFTWHLLGVTSLTRSSMIAIGLTHTFFCDAKCWLMAPFANLNRISNDELRREPRRVTATAFLGCALGALAAVAFVIHLSYRGGAYNFGVATFRWAPARIFQHAISRMQNPFPPSWDRIGFMGLGAAFTALTTYLRYQFAWWPLHPIGFTISSSMPTREGAFAIFWVWLIKLVILRLGGQRAYEKGVPFCVGLIVGHALAIGVGILIDGIWFYGQGHPIHGF